MEHLYANFIQKVAKPTRYLGGEYMSAEKNPADVDVHVALAFPDVYEIGMSHMGTKILYSILNGQEDMFAERVFCPWTDMEEELRNRQLPLVSLESQTPLHQFDVIGFSLQFELTFTNVLTMLDLGGVPLRSDNRNGTHPFIIGGGPVATHPEPMAPFFDGFFIGEAEEEFPKLLRELAGLKKQGMARREILIQLASKYPLYVPSLYSTKIDEHTGLEVVDKPLDERVPTVVRRALVENIDDYPFPSDTPVPYAEAVFDRAGVEIARGCTEGCRFCQAGMIYRPVRERSPESIVKSVTEGIEKAGYQETALTSLSTADYSAITPLVRTVMTKLRKKNVSLSVSSLRAYGLSEAILDDMAASRITGLTFAPEAGTQRMRDVVNKNIREEHIELSTKRVFERGWDRLKLYFMIGLPTEEDEDVVGIIETGERMLAVGKKYAGKRANVTVSVSSHVPKPHTPFQWCAQDSIDEIKRKQRLMRESISQRQLRLKYHDVGTSFVEGVFARGDRRLAEALETGWQKGIRFDCWDELFDLDTWKDVFAQCEVDTDLYLGTRPVHGRLPWDHLDVGLEDGFLLGEYRKAVKNRLSPPCGKVAGDLVHHSNLEDARAEKKRLVCYDCGVACDLSRMKTQRIDYLTTLGAEKPLPARPPVRALRSRRKDGNEQLPEDGWRYRIQYTKLGRLTYLGHLDMTRVLIRTFRRTGTNVAYSRGYHPMPLFSFSPALPLGVASLGELLDVTLKERIDPAELLARLNETTPEGLTVVSCSRLPDAARKLSKVIGAFDYLMQPRDGGDLAQLQNAVKKFRDAQEVPFTREKKNGKVRNFDIKPFVQSIEVIEPMAESQSIFAALDWPSKPVVRTTMSFSNEGSVKPTELANALFATQWRIVRLGFPQVDFVPTRDSTFLESLHSHNV